MSGTAKLDVFRTVQLDGAGNGLVSLGPTGSGETWSGVTASVHVSTNTLEAQCRIFAGPSAEARFFRDATYAGSTGDATSKLPPVLAQGEQVYAQWSLGDPGATAYLTLSGTRNVA